MPLAKPAIDSLCALSWNAFKKRRSRSGLTFLVQVFLAFLLTPAAFGATEITVDGSLDGGTYEGIGGLSAGAGSRLLADYPEKQKRQILDLLFKPKFGASLQHLKVENGGDAQSTFGSEPAMMRTQREFERAVAALKSRNPNAPQFADVQRMFKRGYEFWLCAEGKKRNPALLLDSLQWGAPGWVGNGTIYSEDNADYLVQFIKGAKAYWNLDFDFVGGNQNEAYNPGNWVKTLRKALDAAGLGSVKINVVDLYREELTKFEAALNADTELQKATYAVGSHYVIESLKDNRFVELTKGNAERNPYPQRVWIGEETAQVSKTARAEGLYRFALNNAWAFNRNHVECKATMPGEYCFPVCSWPRAMDYYWYDDGFVNCYEPWSGHYDVTPSLWAVAHTTQFTAPGWKYLGGKGCGLLADGGSYVTLKAPSARSCDYSIVIETKDAARDQTLSFTLEGNLSRGRRQVWESSGATDKTWFTHPSNRLSTDTGGKFSITVHPNSIVTITTTMGQSKGGFADIPRSAPFPARYREDFESYAVGKTPRYIADYYGAFEVATDSDPAHGKCLEQQITRQVIRWFGLDDRNYTQTLLGDKDWKNYEVGVDAKMNADGFVEIGVRCGPYRSAELVGPHLRVTFDGQWTLGDSSGTVLAKGKVPRFRGGIWHRYLLKCVGNTVAAFVDGVPKAAAATSQQQGAVYLATGRTRTRFDNLSITPLAPARPGASSLCDTVRFGSTRNDLTGAVGVKLVLGDGPMTVVRLGRAYVPGNRRSHVLKIQRVADGSVVARTIVSMSKGAADVRGYKYAELRSPVVLAPKTAYYLSSSEAAGGDRWFEPSETTAVTDAGVRISGICFEKGSWTDRGTECSACVNLEFMSDSFAGHVSMGTVRNNFSGPVGMRVTVGSTPLTVTKLGRSFLAGNRGIRALRITRMRDQVVLAEAGLDLSKGVPDSRGFKYVALPRPVTLEPGSSYAITTTEIGGGDSWYDVDSAVTTNTGAKINGIYRYKGQWHDMESGRFYGGVSFLMRVDIGQAMGKPAPSRPGSATHTSSKNNRKSS